MSSVKIIPAAEVIFDSGSRLKAIQKLKSSNLSFPEILIKKLARGRFFPEASLMADFFYDSPAGALDFFYTPCVFWSDKTNVQGKQNPFHGSLKSIREEQLDQNKKNSYERKSFRSILIENFF